ncbi:MAG: hypothetical protein KC417_02030, partial [Myxococcales bacterium]|nr:hypothetical protein [Myxococcales bacterium]
MATRKISIPRDFDEVMRGFLLPTRAKVWRELLADVMRHALREGIAQPTPMGALRAADAGLRRAMESLRVVQERSARLQQDAARAVDDAERRQVMIAHLIETVPDLGRRKGDLRALDRALDIEALVDREIERAVEATQTGMMCLEILRRAYVVAGPESRETWREDGKLLPLIFEVVGSDFKPPFREEAFLTLAEWVHVDPALAAHVERERVESVATDRRENVWVQAAAIRALAVADADAGIRVVCE